MTLEELYKKLDIEVPEELIYFEQMAELVECEETIPFEIFREALSAIRPETAGDFVENYFEEFSNLIPNNEDDMASLVEFIKQKLLMSARNLGNGSSETDFTEQLYDFRQWYHKPDGVLLDGSESSVFNAAVELRVQKLGIGVHEYDFSPSLDYDLDSMNFNLGILSDIDMNNGDNYESDCDTEQ